MHDLDRQLDDVVLFELPTHEDVEAFCERIRPRWEGWSDAEEETWLCAAQLERSGDLAPLLREVQKLIAELGLDSIYFSVDGRAYRLEAARLPREANLAARSN